MRGISLGWSLSEGEAVGRPLLAGSGQSRPTAIGQKRSFRTEITGVWQAGKIDQSDVHVDKSASPSHARPAGINVPPVAQSTPSSSRSARFAI